MAAWINTRRSRRSSPSVRCCCKFRFVLIRSDLNISWKGLFWIKCSIVLSHTGGTTAMFPHQLCQKEEVSPNLHAQGFLKVANTDPQLLHKQNGSVSHDRWPPTCQKKDNLITENNKNTSRQSRGKHPSHHWRNHTNNITASSSADASLSVFKEDKRLHNKVHSLRLCKDVLIAGNICWFIVEWRYTCVDDNMSDWFPTFWKDTRRFIAFALVMKGRISEECTHTSFFHRCPPQDWLDEARGQCLLAGWFPWQPNLHAFPKHSGG